MSQVAKEYHSSQTSLHVDFDMAWNKTTLSTSGTKNLCRTCVFDSYNRMKIPQNTKQKN